ncbi:MAG: hypothetical protein R3F20_02350 [Planctomycetota bacterium]
MLRHLGALLLGLLAGNLWNAALVLLNTRVLFPAPEGLDFSAGPEMRAYVASLPAVSFLVVIVAHVGQVAIGGLVAARLAVSRRAWLVGVIGVLTGAGAVYHQVAIGGPDWMWVDVGLVLAVTIGLARRVSRAERFPSGA